jgi:hypothetical protein
MRPLRFLEKFREPNSQHNIPEDRNLTNIAEKPTEFFRQSASLQACAAMYMVSALFWDITQRRVVILY